jgi:VanZ family protein
MESASPPRSKLAVAVCLVAAVYWLATFVATHVPAPPASSFDKVGHLVAFAGLAVLLCAASATWQRPSWGLYAGLLGIIAAYAAGDELTQMLVPQRTADVRDWIADMLGAVLGIAAFSLGWAIVRQLSQRPAEQESSRR